MAISKNLFYILVTILVAMVSVAKASTTTAAGEWKLKEVWKENEAETLPITGDGQIYVMKLLPDESNNEYDQEKMNLSIKVGNVMRSSVDILDQNKIKVGFVLSTRMFPGSEEKAQLENYLAAQLPKMNSMEVKVDGEQNKLLILSGEGGARIVCEPAVENQD